MVGEDLRRHHLLPDPTGFQVAHRDLETVGDRRCTVSDHAGDVFDELPEVLEEHVLRREKHVNCARVAEWSEMPTEHEAVKTPEDSSDLVGVTG